MDLLISLSGVSHKEDIEDQGYDFPRRCGSCKGGWNESVENVMQGKDSTPSKHSVLRPLVFLALLGAIIFTMRYFQLDQYLEKERLRQAVAGYGASGPLIYMLIWVAAPPLFLPVLPFPWLAVSYSAPFGGWSIPSSERPLAPLWPSWWLAI